MASGTGQYLGGRYELLGLIGAASLGQVWGVRLRGSDDLSDEPVLAALVLRADLSDDADVVGRFVGLRGTLLGLDHPGLVRVVDLVADDGRLAFVMEFMPGGSLSDALAGLGTVPAWQALALGCQVLDGLAYAHGLGLVHGDVRTSGVLLGRGGVAAPDEVKLSGLGVSTAVGGGIASSAYMAPELFTGEAASPASDVYGVGVVLYELLGGHTPFGRTDESGFSGFRQVLDTPPVLPVASSVWTLLETMLAKDPAARPTAEEAADRLWSLLGSVEGCPALPVQPEPVWADDNAVAPELPPEFDTGIFRPAAVAGAGAAAALAGSAAVGASAAALTSTASLSAARTAALASSDLADSSDAGWPSDSPIGQDATDGPGGFGNDSGSGPGGNSSDGGPGGNGSGGRPASPESESDEPRKKRPAWLLPVTGALATILILGGATGLAAASGFFDIPTATSSAPSTAGVPVQNAYQGGAYQGDPTDLDGLDPNATDPNATDPNATDPNATDPNATDPNATDPNATTVPPTCGNCTTGQNGQSTSNGQPAANNNSGAGSTKATSGPTSAPTYGPSAPTGSSTVGTLPKTSTTSTTSKSPSTSTTTTTTTTSRPPSTSTTTTTSKPPSTSTTTTTTSKPPSSSTEITIKPNIVSAGASPASGSTSTKFTLTVITSGPMSELVFTLTDNSGVYRLSSAGVMSPAAWNNTASASVSADKKTWTVSNLTMSSGKRVFTVTAYDPNGALAGVTTFTVNVS